MAGPVVRLSKCFESNFRGCVAGNSSLGDKPFAEANSVRAKRSIARHCITIGDPCSGNFNFFALEPGDHGLTIGPYRDCSTTRSA
jgi:hypothetical protein